MKTIFPALRANRLFAAVNFSLAMISAGFAQTSSIPTVIVGATQPIATVSNSGAFTLFRIGDTNAALNVWYDLGGTASNGVDYAAIPPHLVQIPAGAVSNVIVIAPLTNPPDASALETVVLTLTNSPMMTPVNYQIGSPSSATVYLADNDVTNLPPRVNIYRPTNGAAFFAPVNVPIFATASDSTGITSIEFFANGQDLGLGTLAGCVTPTIPCPGCPPPPQPICFYYLYWSNAPVGNYSLTAVITDEGGLLTTSAPVNITVQLPTNPPVVSIVSPTNGATFAAPANIPLVAKASDPDGSVTNVEFFANGADLGRGASIVLDPPGVNGVTGLVYFFNWQNVRTNGYTVTAVATDNSGLSTTSAPVNLTVLPGPANPPPVARIDTPTNGQTFFASVVCPPCVTDSPPCALPCSTAAFVPIYATASAASGLASVEFFANGQDLGPGAVEFCVTPAGTCVGCPPPVPICTYYLAWTNAPVGTFALTAVATDNGGLSTTSAPVNITVQLPPTNLPPVVRITSPPNGAVFFAPINLPLFAYAAGLYPVSNVFFDTVTNLEFYADGADLGPAKHVSFVPPPTPGGAAPQYVGLLTDRFFLIWTNAPVGPHQLTAVAVDQFGNAATSAPVAITIETAPPPPTNRPAIVRIVATDPIAIEGTNCWTRPGLIAPNATWSNWFAPNAVFCRFTNCGPKDATFAVFRFGDTNRDLAVAYAIGGTASNGVDYIALPGVVTIPAGERRADITIVPLDDGPPDITSTVILKLVPDATGTNYVLGFPRAAGALILDSQSPQTATGIAPGSVFNLAAAGPDGAWFHVEESADLVNWTPICTNQVVNGSINFVDPDAATNPLRFYRTVPETGPPQ